jgi:hypothetical protein
MKVCVEMEHELTYTLDIHSYKRDSGSKPLGYVQHIQRIQNLCLSNKFIA